VCPTQGSTNPALTIMALASRLAQRLASGAAMDNDRTGRHEHGCPERPRLPTCAPDHHSHRSWTKLLAGLDAGDTDDEQLARTWIAAQDLRLLYHAADRARAEQAFYPWLIYCADADIPPGVPSCWPTSTPAGSPMDPPKRSTY
jgi:hypothetical protein